MSAAGSDVEALYYRTSGGAEVDLVLDLAPGRRVAIEVKRTAAPSVSRGLRSALDDLAPQEAYVVYAGEEELPLGGDVRAIGLPALARRLAEGGDGTEGRI